MMTCPVCYYDQLIEPPANFSICPCCGTEFGNDDFDVSHATLRKRWLDSGAKWWSPNNPPPRGWSAVTQSWNAATKFQVAMASLDPAVYPIEPVPTTTAIATLSHGPNVRISPYSSQHADTQFFTATDDLFRVSTRSASATTYA